MQITKHETYRLLPTSGCASALVGIRDGSDRDCGEGEIQVCALSVSSLCARLRARDVVALRHRYPYVATEVLCSEIWSVVETCVNNPDHLLAPFWETVLDRSPEDMKTQMVMASHFTKINTVFLNKKPAEVRCLLEIASMDLMRPSDARLHPIAAIRCRTDPWTHRNPFFCGPPRSNHPAGRNPFGCGGVGSRSRF
jgi:hypothetical protein